MILTDDLTDAELAADLADAGKAVAPGACGDRFRSAVDSGSGDRQANSLLLRRLQASGRKGDAVLSEGPDDLARLKSRSGVDYLTRWMAPRVLRVATTGPVHIALWRRSQWPARDH